MLHNVVELNDIGGPIFCGPFAMSAVTGKKLSEVYKALKALDFHESTQATHTNADQILHGMYDLGFSESHRMTQKNLYDAMWTPAEPRKEARLSDLPDLQNSITEVYIVGVPGHWVAYDHGKMCCNINREIVTLEEYITRHGDQPIENLKGFNSLA